MHRGWPLKANPPQKMNTFTTMSNFPSKRRNKNTLAHISTETHAAWPKLHVSVLLGTVTKLAFCFCSLLSVICLDFLLCPQRISPPKPHIFPSDKQQATRPLLCVCVRAFVVVVVAVIIVAGRKDALLNTLAFVPELFDETTQSFPLKRRSFGGLFFKCFSSHSLKNDLLVPFVSHRLWQEGSGGT